MNSRPSLYLLTALLAGCCFVESAQAHFVWVKSIDHGKQASAVLYFGESAADENYHLPERIAEASLWQRTNGKKLRQLKLEKVETDDRVGLQGPLENNGPTILAATCEYGIYGNSLLSYYAKHVRCKSARDLGAAGRTDKLQLEIVPRLIDGQIELTVYWQNGARADVELEVTEPDGETHSLKTDAEGRARFRPAKAGLVGVRAGFTDREARGEFDGAKYVGAAHYATLTFRIQSLDMSSQGESRRPKKEQTDDAAKAASDLPALPEAVASFGAAVHDGWLYVYGGHIGGAHDHSRDNLSQRFQRLKLDGGEAWQALRMQTPLQGLALVAHKSGLYRIGGMNARNAADAEEELYSTAAFWRYVPESQLWTRMPDLPEPRSSHDAVVIGDKLYVAGGWTLAGDGNGEWCVSAIVFDLANPKGQWTTVPPAPFHRRALAVSQWNQKLVVLGGIDDQGDVSFAVDLYDPASKTWSSGPKLPGQGMEAFGVSAWNLAGELYVSGLGGTVIRLASDRGSWDDVVAMKQPRFFHQLLPYDAGSLIAVAGASHMKHLAQIERLQVVDSNDANAGDKQARLSLRE